MAGTKSVVPLAITVPPTSEGWAPSKASWNVVLPVVWSRDCVLSSTSAGTVNVIPLAVIVRAATSAAVILPSTSQTLRPASAFAGKPTGRLPLAQTAAAVADWAGASVNAAAPTASAAAREWARRQRDAAPARSAGVAEFAEVCSGMLMGLSPGRCRPRFGRPPTSHGSSVKQVSIDQTRQCVSVNRRLNDLGGDTTAPGRRRCMPPAGSRMRSRLLARSARRGLALLSGGHARSAAPRSDRGRHAGGPGHPPPGVGGRPADGGQPHAVPLGVQGTRSGPGGPRLPRRPAGRGRRPCPRRGRRPAPRDAGPERAGVGDRRDRALVGGEDAVRRRGHRRSRAPGRDRQAGRPRHPGADLSPVAVLLRWPWTGTPTAG